MRARTMAARLAPGMHQHHHRAAELARSRRTAVSRPVDRSAQRTVPWSIDQDWPRRHDPTPADFLRAQAVKDRFVRPVLDATEAPWRSGCVVGWWGPVVRGAPGSELGPRGVTSEVSLLAASPTRRALSS